MDEVQIMIQTSIEEFIGALQNALSGLMDLYQQSGLSQYHFVFRFTEALLFVVIPLTLVVLVYALVKHPLYFIARSHPILKLSWRKIAHLYQFHKTSKVLAENEHYGFKPQMDLITYRSSNNLFSSIEVFSLGKRKFALLIPEKLWQSSQDSFYSLLLKPKKELKARSLALNTLTFFFTNYIKKWQQTTFHLINSKIKNVDLKNFFLISIYIFFLPLVYTRLNLRFYAYHGLMKSLYGETVANRLSLEQKNELDEFLNKPITYFFGLIHEKS